MCSCLLWRRYARLYAFLPSVGTKRAPVACLVRALGLQQTWDRTFKNVFCHEPVAVQITECFPGIKRISHRPTTDS